MNKRVVEMLIRAFAESLVQALWVLNPFLAGLLVSSLGREVWALEQGANLTPRQGLDRQLEGHEVDCLVARLVSKVCAVVPAAEART